MERVAILGSGGAGKSALAAVLATRTGLPVVHLDVLFWRPDWTPAPVEEFRAELNAAVARDGWILDGNFLRDDDDPRFGRVDTVICLDLPRSLCLWRAIWRSLRHRRRSRLDLPEDCPESLDLSFLRWVWCYPGRNRPDVLGRLAGLGPHVRVHRLRSRADVRRYVATL